MVRVSTVDYSTEVLRTVVYAGLALFVWFVYGLVDTYCLTSVKFAYGLLINGYVFGID